MSDPQKVLMVPKGTSFVVEHRVPTASRDTFLALEKSLDEAARQMPGYESVEVEELPPEGKDVLRYRTTLTFQSQDALLGWVDSDVRHKLIQQAKESFAYGYALRSSFVSFDAWFPKPEGSSEGPESWKMNLLVLVTLYPTVLALGPILRPITSKVDFATAMLLGNIASVSITGWILMPLANKLWASFLRPRCAAGPLLGGLAASVLILLVAWLLNRG